MAAILDPGALKKIILFDVWCKLALEGERYFEGIFTLAMQRVYVILYRFHDIFCRLDGRPWLEQYSIP
jgi:hypothetical protein